MSDKDYNELSDNERAKLREYQSWLDCDAPHEYRLSMLESIYKTLKILGIEHLTLPRQGEKQL